MRRWLWLAVAMLAGCALPGERPAPPPAAEAAVLVPVVPEGYAIRLAAEGLADPRGVAVGPEGLAYVVEGRPAGLLRIDPDGSLVPVASGGDDGPWTSAAFVNRHFAVAEAGGRQGARILAIAADGSRSTLLRGLPEVPAIALAAGPDGWLYAAVASAAHGIACQDLRFRQGGRVEGQVPCTGAVLRLGPGERDAEVFAWGFRQPVGLDFAPDGRLLLAERQDLVWEVTAGVWYGWPDYHGQLALADPLLAGIPNPPPPPLATVPRPVRALAVARGTGFGPPGGVFVAEEGGTVARLDGNGEAVPFAAGFGEVAGLAFDPGGGVLWVADGGTGRLWRIEGAAR